MLRHLQSGVTQQLLEHKSIPATINKIFPGEGMAIQMGACLGYPAGLVMAGYGKPQSVHREHTTILVAEQIIVAFAFADGHILPQNGDHHRA